MMEYKPQMFTRFFSVLSSPETERRSSGEEDGLGFRFGFLKEPEEGVVLHADLPEDLTAVSAGHGELQRVVVGVLLYDINVKCESGCRKQQTKGSVRTYSGVCSQLNEEPFAFEAELANLGPVEGVNFCVTLNKDTTQQIRHCFH